MSIKTSIQMQVKATFLTAIGELSVVMPLSSSDIQYIPTAFTKLFRYIDWEQISRKVKMFLFQPREIWSWGTSNLNPSTVYL